MATLDLQSISKSFGSAKVLHDISLAIADKEFVVFVGPSGCGKSTLLRIIAGLEETSEGKILIGGDDVSHANPVDRGISMVFQSYALYPHLTVFENIAFPLRMFTQKTPAQIRERVNFVLDRVKLPSAQHLLPAELSGGMMKRVGIARAIALNPKYLFVDEPNSGLDPLTASVIDKLIQDLTYEYEMTTIVVSHDMNSVLNIGDRVNFLYKGKKEWEGTNKEIFHADSAPLQEFVFVSDLIRRD